MQIKISSLLACTSAIFFASVTVAAPVSTTSNFIVFGNSLSDNGNAAKLLNNSAYWDGRYSNSYVWDEYTSKLLGMNLINKAYGGATSNNGVTVGSSENITIPSFHDQVVDWLAANPSPDKFHLDHDVIQIEIGSNDILNNMESLLNGTLSAATLATEVATSISADIKSLLEAGYKNIALWNIPAIEKTPLAAELEASTLVAPVVQTMNSEIALIVGTLIDTSILKSRNVHIFDLHSLMLTCLEPTVLSTLAITDSTGACYVTDSEGNVDICTNPDKHFFYDDIHPASRMHYTWGVAAAILTRSPYTALSTNEIIRLANSFSIGSSSRGDNILVDSITPSESAVVDPRPGHGHHRWV
ncbi:hypothetical protein GGI23_001134 [Coemansia sp. RSA 2559]|nr:hypothetical protein GGI23_001134 [Coemansia sp. RSA 2559]KAJ2866529.1 hypothetical protein GGI22_001263 [Coemansia erecta]